MKELLFWYLKFHFSGILSFSLKWTLHLCSLHCFQKEDIDFSNFLQMSEGCKSSQCPVLKLPSFPPPTSSHTSFIFLPQPVILLHLSASVCYPLVSKPSESGLSKTSTMYLVSDVLVQSLVTSILQCLLSTTYVFFWQGDSCRSPTDLFYRFLWDETQTDTGRTRQLHRPMTWLYHDTHPYLHL